MQMNSQPKEDLQRRLQQLKAEINSFANIPKAGQIPRFNLSQANDYWQRLRLWFNSLSQTKKLATLGGGMLLGYLLLQLVLKLVITVISLVVVAIVLYVGYKIFVSINLQSKQ